MAVRSDGGIWRVGGCGFGEAYLRVVFVALWVAGWITGGQRW